MLNNNRLLFYSAQRALLSEMIAFNHKKCLNWFHKYTIDLSDTLGKLKKIIFYIGILKLYTIIICRA